MKIKSLLSLVLILGFVFVAGTTQAANTKPLVTPTYGVGGTVSGMVGGVTNMMGRGDSGSMLIRLNSAQINSLNGIGSAISDVDTTLHVGQIVSQIMNSAKSKKIDRLCARTAMLKFEDAMAEAWKVYAQANTDAFTARRTAVSSAWDATVLSTGYKSVASAYVNFNKQKLAANKVYNKAKLTAIKNWTNETNACPLAGAANLTPTIAITSPVTGATLASTTPIVITASAAYYNTTDTAGIKEVIFYNGTEAINTDTSAPYSYEWTATVGSKSLTASVLDKDGRRATSSAVTITVN